VLGEIHPLAREKFELPGAPLIAGEFDLEAILPAVPERFHIQAVPIFPPVLEDLAMVVDEKIPAEQVAQLIKETAGSSVILVRLFDIYRGEKIGQGKKSLAYSLTYQAEDRTLTDEEVAKTRQRIIQQLEHELGAKLRS
jgi:phenylalanyl-tRNA synthetase beta chain